MKYSVANFKGMLPIIGSSKLPAGYASKAINTKLTGGDIEGYLDIANPFTLAKTAPIITLEKADNGDWLQFAQSELQSGMFDIRCVPGIIPGDTTGRRFITGYNKLGGVPQWTNTFYATDPSQQGANPAGAFPYVTFPLGIADPSSAATPAASAPAASGTSTTYAYAQEASVNNATAFPTSGTGTGYVVGDKPYINGGSLAPGFNQTNGAAQIQVTSVSATGQITGMILLSGGFYLNALAPSQTTINQAGLTLPAASITVASTSGAPTSGSFTVPSSAGTETVNYTGISGNTFTGCTGGTGTVTNGAAVTLAVVTLSGGSGTGGQVTITPIGQNFNGFSTPQVNNGAGYYVTWAFINNHWWAQSGQGDLTVAYSNTAFSLKSCQTFVFQADMQTDNNGGAEYTDLVMWLCSTYGGGFALSGPGVVLSKTDGTFNLYSSFAGTNGNAVSGTPIQSKSVSVTGNTMYRITATCTQQTAATTPGFSVIVTLALQSSPTSIISTLTGFIPYNGEALGVGTNHRGNHNDGNDGEFENLYVNVGQPASEITVESTNYVYTYVQNVPGDPLTQESGPSDPSPTIDIDINGTTTPATRAPATVVIPPCPAGEYIAYYNLYRLVEDASGNETYTLVTTLAAFTMSSVTGTYTVGETVTGGTSGATALVLSYAGGVLELYDVEGVFTVGETLTGGTSGAHGTYASSDLSSVTITYVDSAQDSAIGPQVLISQNWAPPPANMQGIIAFPNGIMGGFAGNIFCLSAQGYPHAWPVENQYATDTAITSASPIDTTGLLTTQSFPYTAWGTDPSAFSMSKEISIQGCVATRGVAIHKTGVLFPSGNGYQRYAGQGQLDLMRIPDINKAAFSYEQWQALTPSSLVAIVHDDYIFYSYNNGTTKGSFVQDLTPGGFGLIELDFHVTCWYVDRSSDTLYLIPDLSTYPINGSIVSSALNVVSQWEAATTYRPRHWERDEILYGRPVSFTKARTQSNPNGGGGTINMDAFNDQGTAFNGAVSQTTAFTIGPGTVEASHRWGVALDITGPVIINTLGMAEAVEELAEEELA